jgi:hypothetical protein
MPLPLTNEWQLRARTQHSISELDGTVQTVVLPGAFWRCTVSYPTLNSTRWRALEAFLASLEGAGGRFYFGPQQAKTPVGAAGGTPLVNGASQTGSSLITDGWPASTAILKAGDYFHFDVSTKRELKIVTADVSSNVSGQATISFKPPIRQSPSDNAAIVTSSPSCTMMMIDDEQGSVTHRTAGLAAFSLAMREAIT